MPEMISIGECLIELFSKEPIQKASTFNRSLGGDSFNILVAASRLGTKTGYITNFGDDPFESYVRKTITSENHAKDWGIMLLAMSTRVKKQ